MHSRKTPILKVGDESGCENKRRITPNGVIDMVVMKTAYKYRVYPSKEQKEILNRQLFLSKELYNMLLEKSKAYYKETGKTLTEYRMNAWITQIKKERQEFAELHSQVLQNVSKRVSDAYRHFFRRFCQA